MKKSFTYVITTRDRPDAVHNCIGSLDIAHALAFPECQSKCIVIDDSISESNSEELKNRLASDNRIKNLATYAVGKSFHKNILDNLLPALKSHENYISKTFRGLGQGNWDHAGSSNFARLFSYSFFSSDEKILFLDDDIVFGSQLCNEHYIEIDGANALSQLYNSISANKGTLSGTTYLGRTDLSVLEHVFFLLVQLKNYPEFIERNLNLIAEFPETLPIHTTLSEHDNDPSLPKGPGEISGAVLAVNNDILSSHGMINYYNEDWIWILLHGKKSKKIYKCDAPLLHCPPTQKKISFDFMVYQEIGEIIFKSLFSATEQAPQNTHCIEWLRNNYSISHLQGAVTDELLDIDSLINKSMFVLEEINIDKAKKDYLRTQVIRSIDFISEVNQHIRRLKLDDLYNDVCVYLSSAENWKTVLKKSKAMSGVLLKELDLCKIN